MLLFWFSVTYSSRGLKLSDLQKAFNAGAGGSLSIIIMLIFANMDNIEANGDSINQIENQVIENNVPTLKDDLEKIDEKLNLNSDNILLICTKLDVECLRE